MPGVRPEDLYAGDTVSVRFASVLRHYGVVTSRGTILSNSRAQGGVTEQTFHDFAAGRPVKCHGRESHTPTHIVEHRARRYLGRDYDLTGSNCIDFVRQSHRKSPTPWQIGAATLMTLRDMTRRR